MILFFKRLFHRPIYRIDIINWAIRHHSQYHGVCGALHDGLETVNVYAAVSDVFPAHKYENAHHLFNASDERKYWWAPKYWWSPSDWSGDRMRYIKWLRDVYKYDKEDIS